MQRKSNIKIIALNMIKSVSCLFLGFLLVACGSSTRFIPSQHELPAHLPPPDPVKLKFLQKLEQEQIQVIQQGQYVLIRIPSVLLFAKHSPVILWPGYTYLNDVVCYIKSFRKVEVSVNSYDSCCDKHQRMLALTSLRASNVADYLLSQSIDTRIIFTRGMANDKPIVKENSGDAYFANSRIEILFKEEII
jgi:intracellular multiplication protein IcmN